MDSNLTTCWWGPEPKEFLEKVKTLLGSYAQYGSFAGDNLITFGRNLSFLHDIKFIDAFTSIIAPNNNIGYGIMWRLYMFSWAAQSALNKEGDFVECGVSTGTSAAIMCKYLDFASVNKIFYLYDTWGMDHRVDGTSYGFNSETFSEVSDRFSRYKNVALVPGFLPETFAQHRPESISFLHIDLNDAAAEIAVLDSLFDRVVPGGIVLFDDYGAAGFTESKVSEDAWLKTRGYTICELPTGQGLLIK